MREGQPFRVRIISPLKASDADITRRQHRYGQQARKSTEIQVLNLSRGPAALNSSGDILVSAAEILQEATGIRPADCDAILIDCVFDPAVQEIQEATGLPTFGPTLTTLPLIRLIARDFSIIARTQRQCELLADLVQQYGYGESLGSLRALGISYEEAKKESTFEAAMIEQLHQVVHGDRAGAVLFGSTTMALSPTLLRAAASVPLFMPGMVALRVIEQLWYSSLWPARPAKDQEMAEPGILNQ